MTTELSLKLIAEPVTHFAVKRRGKRWVNPLYNLYQFNIKLLKVARYPSGQFQSTASIDGKSPDVTFPVIVTKVPNLNLLGRLAMMKLKLTNLTDHLADTSFDGEEMEDDVDSVCLVRTISRQINPDNPLLVVRETAKDPILSQLMRFVKEGWPHAFSEELKDFKKLENSLSTENGCVFYGLRVIIPSTLRNHILKLLHLGHFGMQRMKQLARSTVYWPRIDFDIENLCRKSKISRINLQIHDARKTMVKTWTMRSTFWEETG